ncbi:rhamnogalacturonan acetylesterase [Pedobacter sp. AJM]|uniref:rhamnogalacturonan acetylesterase n=1 Tax=Pedobacter sp. AJM TaxID=2003629 RepID=UPI000B4BCEE4|nr:rhamnogalacturonan acetylesterase [Pedobacter sp. AJM]OWK70966.1 rhamnogalacturonan acetylesterase [Pedobacter sp. AJM]
MNTKSAFLKMVLFTLLSGTSFAQQTHWRFDFGAEKGLKGYVHVLPETSFESNGQYGFDFGSVVQAVKYSGKKAFPGSGIKSKKPFYFSAAVPEGNYRVTLTMGDANDATASTVKAESRRLMLAEVKTKQGEFVTKTFIVNIKNRNIAAGQMVALKPRELTKLDWDDKLTLEFDGHTVLKTMELTKVDDQITVFLAGNSTVVNQDDEPWASWGQMIPRFFKPGVAIANHAESGLTLGSFIGSRRLSKILSIMKPGDYLFIEFGHNDQKEKGAHDGAYQSYTERLKTFVAETRKKGGIPVIVTSTSRRSFDQEGKIQNTLGDFPDAARKVAAAENVALIDLNAMTTSLFNAMGEVQSKKAFVHYPANRYPGQDKALADNTHFNPFGAYEIARCVVLGIQQQKLGLVKYLINDLPTFDPAQPDDPMSWRWPESPKSSLIKPDGN